MIDRKWIWKLLTVITENEGWNELIRNIISYKHKNSFLKISEEYLIFISICNTLL